MTRAGLASVADTWTTPMGGGDPEAFGRGEPPRERRTLNGTSFSVVLRSNWAVNKSAAWHLVVTPQT